MTRPRLLDLFCGAGGCSVGYHRAGFEAVGVDINPQPNYPYEFMQWDALDLLYAYQDHAGRGFNAIHASPPCQAYTKAQRLQGIEHPDLIGPVRELLQATGLPYVIENVPGAELADPVMLCGSMVGLALYRHRHFETNWPLTQPLHGQHWLRQVKMGRKPDVNEIAQPVGNFSGADAARAAMGIDWMTRDELREAIPPAYTEYIGKQLIQHLQRAAA